MGIRWRASATLGRPFHIHIENRWRLGDEVMALPFYQLVRQRYPCARVTASVNFPELLIGSGIAFMPDADEWNCDRYIFAKDDARTTPRLQHLCQRHRIPYRDMEPLLPVAALNEESPPGASAVHTGRIAYSCGAGWDCKRWSPASMRALCEAMTRKWPGIEFVELGKDCDRVGIGIDRRNQLSIAEVVALLRTCSLYIGPDSGLVHLALAVRTPAVGLYGPVRPAVAFGPRSAMLPVLASAPCAGCWSDGRMSTPGECPLGIRSPHPEDYLCMSSIAPEDVLAAIDERGILHHA